MDITIEAPEHLTDRSKEIFRTAITKNDTPGRLAQVIICLEALDRLDEIRKELNEQGLFITSKRSKLRHPNPLIKVEEKQRMFLLKQWERMGLQWNNSEPFQPWTP